MLYASSSSYPPFSISNSGSKINLTHLQRQHRKPLLHYRLAILQRAGQGRDWVWKWSGHWFASTIPLPTLLPQNPIHSSPTANRQEKLQVVWLGQKRSIIVTNSSHYPSPTLLQDAQFRLQNFFCKPSTASALKQCWLAGFDWRAQPFCGNNLHQQLFHSTFQNWPCNLTTSEPETSYPLKQSARKVAGSVTCTQEEHHGDILYAWSTSYPPPSRMSNSGSKKLLNPSTTYIISIGSCGWMDSHCKFTTSDGVSDGTDEGKCRAGGQ